MSSVGVELECECGISVRLPTQFTLAEGMGIYFLLKKNETWRIFHESCVDGIEKRTA